MRLQRIRLAWKELATVSIFLPAFFLPGVVPSPFFPWVSDSSGVDATAFHGSHLEPDHTALRKVILVPGVRLWGQARIDAHRELEDNFGRLVKKIQKHVLIEEGLHLKHDWEAARRASILSTDSDFIMCSYSGSRFYWSSETRQALAESSRILADLVTATRQLFPNAKLDVLGYSIGGLVILDWARRYASPEDRAALRGVLLFGTPLNGINENWVRSVYSRICLCPILSDVHAESPMVQALRAPLEVPKLVVVNNANDWMVNGKLGDGTSLVTGGECSHFEMLHLGEPVEPFSPMVAVQVMRNHTQILKDDAALEKMASYIGLDCG